MAFEMKETLLVTETDTSQLNGLGLLSCTPPQGQNFANQNAQ